MQNLFNPTAAPTVSSSNASVALDPEQDSSLQLALAAVRAAEDRKAADVTLLRVTEVSLLADYFVISTGYSKAQVRAIANSVADQLQEEMRRAPQHTEGMAEASWVLQDFGDVIVHTLMPNERDFYDLEAFWGHAERVNYQALLES
jgi:ribosome-associated protein